jgi:hypothetical protein
MTDQVLTKEAGQKGATKSFREHALASVELLRGGASARSGVLEKKAVTLSPDAPRFNERHLWLMLTEQMPHTPENFGKIIVKPVQLRAEEPEN